MRDSEHLELLKTIWFDTFDDIFSDYYEDVKFIKNGSRFGSVMYSVERRQMWRELNSSIIMEEDSRITKQHRGYLSRKISTLRNNPSGMVDVFAMTNVCVWLLCEGVLFSIVEEYAKYKFKEVYALAFDETLFRNYKKEEEKGDE